MQIAIARRDRDKITNLVDQLWVLVCLDPSFIVKFVIGEVLTVVFPNIISFQCNPK